MGVRKHLKKFSASMNSDMRDGYMIIDKILMIFSLSPLYYRDEENEVIFPQMQEFEGGNTIL
jgi:hypothetical protein